MDLNSGPRRRLPAKEKSIADIRSDKDVRVRIMGTIIGKGDNYLMVDDGTASAQIGFVNLELMKGFEEGQFIKIITRILPLIDGYECRGEAIQDLTGINLELYKKAHDILG
jgi:hypothetical protein